MMAIEQQQYDAYQHLSLRKPSPRISRGVFAPTIIPAHDQPPRHSTSHGDGEQPLHPMNPIPYEIYLHIFLRCLPDPDEADDCFDTRHAPWSISRVCRLWRDIIVSSPQLWAEIFFRTKSLTPSTLRLLLQQLEYSQHYPLHLRIRMGGQPPRDPAISALKALIREHSRWSSFEVSSGRCYLLRELQHAGKLSFPVLRRISWSFWRLETIGPDITWDWFDDCPALRSVIIPTSKRQADQSRIGPIRLPWSQITHMSLLGPERYIILSILPRTSSIVELSLADTELDDMSVIEKPATPYSLLNLQRLDIRGCSFEFASHLLQNSVLSSSFLELFISHYPIESTPPGVLQAMFGRLPGSLQDLRICCSRTHPHEDLSSFLSLVPSRIRHLQLDLPTLRFSDTWLNQIGRALAVPKRSTTDNHSQNRLICPTLEHLTLLVASPRNSPFKLRKSSAFLDMLESRLHSDSPEDREEASSTANSASIEMPVSKLKFLEVDPRWEWTSSETIKLANMISSKGLRLVRTRGQAGTLGCGKVDMADMDVDSDDSDWE